MKITLDADRLLKEGLLSEEEYHRLSSLSGKETGSLALGGLIAFGVIAVASGLVLLFPSSATVVAVGLAMIIAGVSFSGSETKTKRALSSIMLALGALTFSGGSLSLIGPHPSLFIFLAVLFAVLSFFSNSSLLASLSPIYVFFALGSWFGYGFALYTLSISYPLISVVLFSSLALGSWHFREHLPHESQHLAVVFARTCLLLVNLAFWVGSLWGAEPSVASGLSPITFGALWVLALVGTAIWAASRNLRWTVNLCITFGAVHFYTQYFTFLSSSPLTLIFAGCLALVIAVIIVRVNKGMGPGRPPDCSTDSPPSPTNPSPSFTLPVVQLSRRAEGLLP